jgi:hypothetical protein
MKLKQYIIEALAANEERVEDRHLEFAAKIGLLPQLLEQTNLAENHDFAWSYHWGEYKTAGHECPKHSHTYDDEDTSEFGTVWGYDTIEAFGVEHTQYWVAWYGGSNPGWNGVSHDDWVVERDSEGFIRNDCLQAMAEVFRIDLTQGQPPEPNLSDCVQDNKPTMTVYVLTEDGKLDEIEIYRFSHPKEALRDENGNITYLPEESPFPHYYSDKSGEQQYDSWRDMIKALKDGENVLSVHEDESEAETAQLRLLADLAVDKHGEPSIFDLYVPKAKDQAPYLIPQGGEDVEEDRYHLDADQWRNVIDHGWVAIASDLEDAWGKRAALAALKERRDQAKAILATRPQTVWVSLASSYAAGNCRQGTAAFLREHGIDPEKVGAIRADALLEMEPTNPFIQKACELAALGVH